MSPAISNALQSLSRTRQLLTLLITSSESFDYPAAKEALKEVQKMIRELAREEARLNHQASPQPEKLSANILAFPEENP
ncbi:MAG TPA: hypothetical protein VGR78_07620 [Verrucomicrobiae bacterium]|jgi:hypothetical protein|nr:hypothetical protein [Verrucomicrobiae bacterium]